MLGRMCILPAPVALSESSVEQMSVAMEQWYQQEQDRMDKEGRVRWGEKGSEGLVAGAGKGGRKRRGSRSGSE